MRILHTADWHIGKVLHKQSLAPEMDLFLDWLLELLDKESIDVLLVSGDIFDIANPSVKDRGVYYRFLSRLIGSGVQVIITGGNHDSVGLLDAPQEILQHLNVNVVGGAKANLEEELIEVRGNDGAIELVIAAVPFLRDRDLRKLESGKDKNHSRVEALKLGIRQHYEDLSRLCLEHYPSTPALAMGHLYARGVASSESEREIHMGNSVAVESDIFGDHFGYVALGHIHRPQIIGENPFIRYSGSPIALSFSEKEDQKCVLIVNVEDGKFSTPIRVDVPKNRQLKRITGNLTEVKQALEEYKPEFPLPSFVSIEIEEDVFSEVILAEVEELISNYNKGERFSILKSKTNFTSGAKDTSDLFKRGENIEDMRPLDVFDKLLESRDMSTEDTEMLRSIFSELLESIHESD